jgi:hypothetical protein
VTAKARTLGKTTHLFAGKLGVTQPSDDWHLHAITPTGYPLEQAEREAPELLVRAIQAAF